MTNVRALGGSSPSSLFAVGSSSYRYKSGSWTAGPFQDSRLMAVCTTSSDDAFVVGREGTLRHWDGVAVEPFVSHTTVDLLAVFMTGRVLVMAGADGTLDTLVFHR